MKMNDFRLIGVLHLLPLPGAPGFGGSMEEVCERALRDAEACFEGGLDAVVVENFGDAPFTKGRVPAETVAAMARVAGELRRAGRGPLGFNVLRNDAASALGLSAAFDGKFVRVNVLTGAMVTDQGLIEGEAFEVARLRESLCPGVEIWADVLVKHATPLGDLDLVQSARDTLGRGGADALILSGSGTGEATPLADLESVREACPEGRILVGSGASPSTVGDLLEFADGVIVGTALKRDGQVRNPVEQGRVEALVEAAGG